MFLELNCSLLNIINSVLGFIEQNKTLVGIVSSVIVGSLWFRKFLKQKRAEAFFGFYARLSICLKNLMTLLEEHNQLNISDSKSGNIFSMIYLEDYIKIVCPGYKEPNEKELDLYKNAVKELKTILIQTDNNVYPRKSERNQWYESQYVLYNFCEYIDNEEYKHTTNNKDVPGTSDPKHIAKCKKLLKAIEYIQSSIENEKY